MAEDKVPFPNLAGEDAVPDQVVQPPAEAASRGAGDLEAVFDELDRKVGEAIDIYVNNRLVARGEVVLVEDKLGVTMTEIIKADRN
jgi:flagellar motor switch protein FliN/FliY